MFIVALVVMLDGCSRHSFKSKSFDKQAQINHLPEPVIEKKKVTVVKAPVAAEEILNDTSCKVPNPNPIPNESTEFYGECRKGNGFNGLVIWKNNGVPSSLSCLIKGEYYPAHTIMVKYTNITRDDVCGNYFPLLPSFCKLNDYVGQCKNGKPEGLGVKTIRLEKEDSQGLGFLYDGLIGQFLNGFPNGYIEKVHGHVPDVRDTIKGMVNTKDIHSYWFVNGNQEVNCDGLIPKKCKEKHLAEPARSAKANKEQKEHESNLQKFRTNIREGDDTTDGVVVQVKGSLIKVQTNESQCTQRDYKDNCVNWVNTPAEKWFKKSEVYPSR